MVFDEVQIKFHAVLRKKTEEFSTFFTPAIAMVL